MTALGAASGKPRRRQMTAQATGLDSEFRQRVVDTMITVLTRLLDCPEPVTEDMRLVEELGLSSTLGLELLLEVEDQLLILIDVEEMGQDQMITVGDMATFVVGHSRPG
jgi:acyl carrier protein